MQQELRELVIQLITEHEGFRRHPYNDLTGERHRSDSGKLTIAYGRNLEDVGISEVEALYLLASDINRVHLFLSAFIWWSDLSVIRRAVVCDLCFQLGASRFLGFRKTITFIRIRDYKAAAVEMLNSRWAQQTPNRANRLSKMFLTNTYHEYTVNHAISNKS